jgi:hypothetical protein
MDGAMSNPVSLGELNKALDATAWEMVQKIVDDMPPFLADDELTVERFYAKNKGKMSRKEARTLLDKLAEDGLLEKQPRRYQGKPGHPIAYVLKEKQNSVVV